MSSQANQGISKTYGGMAVGAAVLAGMAHAKGSDTIKVGLLGCGGRGNGALAQCLQADPGVEVIALADLFEARVRRTLNSYNNNEKFKDRVKIDDDHLYWGYDCYLKLAQCEADLLLMTSVPAFRGREMMAAIKAGKHIFTEKPIATDVAGCREVIAASRLAEDMGLSIVAGTQRRHELNRIELMKRIHDGAIGELVGGQCYWYGGGIWFRGADADMDELAWQCHNWYHFNWLSGDQICEQHIHNIDVLNWCFQGPPRRITAVGGRQWRCHNEGQVRTAKEVCKRFNNGSEEGWEKYNGDIWDHIYAEFEYPNGARCLSFSGHSPGTGRNGEKIVGSKGNSDCRIATTGANPWKYEGRMVDGMLQEHVHLIQAIRSGKPLNEGVQIAESTLTAIGARIAAYTGQVVTWDWLLKESKQNLVPTLQDMIAGKPLYHPIPTGRDALV